MLDLSAVFIWSAWYPLEGCWRGRTIPQRAGLYRIRRTGRTDLDYIGQTGMGSMTLRQRLGMLGGVYALEMPYRDPHTAAPALWALRHQSGCTFEVAVMPVDGSTPYRKGLEALAIGLYRQQHGRSPTISFGRMPVGYRISSANNRRLAESGQRVRGGPSDTIDDSHLPSQPPAGPLSANAVALEPVMHLGL